MHDCKITKNHKISRYQRIEFVSDFLEFLDFFSPRRLTTRSQILREQSHQSTRKESIISRRPMVQVRIGKVDRYHVQLSGLSSQGQRKCEKCEGCGTERLERMMVQRKMMEWRQLNAEFVVKLNLERQKQTKLTTSCSSSPCSEGLTKMFNGPAVRFYPPC